MHRVNNRHPVVAKSEYCWAPNHLKTEIDTILAIFLLLNLTIQATCIVYVNRRRLLSLDPLPIFIRSSRTSEDMPLIVNTEPNELAVSPPRMLTPHKIFCYLTLFSTAICSTVSTWKLITEKVYSALFCGGVSVSLCVSVSFYLYLHSYSYLCICICVLLD